MRAGICTQVWKHYKFHTDLDWLKRLTPKGFSNGMGVVLWNRICFSMPADDIPHWLFRHELEHVYQQIREGRVRFYLKYFYYSLRYGYQNNPYEVEAYSRQHDPLTTSEEQALWKLREDSQQ